MYCRNCGKEITPGANVCGQCGVPVGRGNHYCPNCGSETSELAVICVKCGAGLTPGAPHANAGGAPYTAQTKSRLVAGLLGVLLGALGIHNFYLGYTNKGIVQLLVCTVGSILCGIGPFVAWVWGLVEGIQIFTGTIHTDADGRELGE